MIKIPILALLILGITSCSSDDSTKKEINTITEVQINEDEYPLFQIYGEKAPADYLDDANEITEDFGFRLERVAGCEIEENEADKVKKNNQVSLQLMNKRHGDDWKRIFEEKTGLKLAIPF